MKLTVLQNLSLLLCVAFAARTARTALVHDRSTIVSTPFVRNRLSSNITTPFPAGQSRDGQLLGGDYEPCSRTLPSMRQEHSASRTSGKATTMKPGGPEKRQPGRYW